MCLEYLQRKTLHDLSEQPVPVLCHLYSRQVLHYVQMKLPMLQFVPVQGLQGGPNLISVFFSSSFVLFCFVFSPDWSHQVLQVSCSAVGSAHEMLGDLKRSK